MKFILILIWLLIFILGCNLKTSIHYRLENGDVCEYEDSSHCGPELWNCKSGKHYFCYEDEIEEIR